ncbi:BnaCnng11760D [Brassica napus]|uniref:BnaCnng11760D protein n=1 Tax=Brassica napus TaxID=3708 RepID=A0A078I1R6_BRANA|nr:BnaCnng11760D [Brassica napus]
MVRQGDGFEGNDFEMLFTVGFLVTTWLYLVQEAAQITIGTYGQQEHNSAYVVDLVIDDADIIQHFDPHPHFVIFNDYESEED